MLKHYILNKLSDMKTKIRGKPKLKSLTKSLTIDRVKKPLALLVLTCMLANLTPMYSVHAEPNKTMLKSFKFKLDKYSRMFNMYKSQETFPKQGLRIGYHILYRQTAIFLYEVSKSIKGDSDVSTSEAISYIENSNKMADSMLFNGTLEKTDYIQKFTGDNGLKVGGKYNLDKSLSTPSKDNPIKVISPSDATYTAHQGAYNVIRNYFYPNKIFEDSLANRCDQQCIMCMDSLLRSSFVKIESDLKVSDNNSVSSITREYQPFVELYEEQQQLLAEFREAMSNLGISKKLKDFSYTKDKNGIILQRYLDNYKKNTAINSSILDIEAYLSQHDVKSKQELAKLIDFTSETTPLTPWYTYLLASTAVYRPLTSRAGDVEYMKTIGDKHKDLIPIYEKFGYKRKPLLQVNSNQYSDILKNKCNKFDTKFVTLKDVRDSVLNNKSNCYVVARTPYNDKGDVETTYNKIEKVKEQDKVKQGGSDKTGAGTVDGNNEEKEEEKKLESIDVNAKDICIFGHSSVAGLKDCIGANDSYTEQVGEFQKDSQDYKNILTAMTETTANMFVLWLDSTKTFKDDRDVEMYESHLKSLLDEVKAKGLKGTPTVVLVKPVNNDFWSKLITYVQGILDGHGIKQIVVSYTDIGLSGQITNEKLKMAYENLKKKNTNTNSAITVKKQESTSVQDDYIKANIKDSHYSSIVFSTGFWAENDWKTDSEIQYKFNSFNMLNMVLHNIMVNRTIDPVDLNSPLYMDFLGNIVTQNNIVLVPAIANYALYGTNSDVEGHTVCDQVKHFMVNRAFLCSYPKFADSKDSTSLLVNGDEKKFALKLRKGVKDYTTYKPTGYSLKDYSGFVNKYADSTVKNATDIEKQAKSKFKRYDEDSSSYMQQMYNPVSWIYDTGLFVKHAGDKAEIASDVMKQWGEKQANTQFAQDFPVGFLEEEGASDSVSNTKSSDARKIFMTDGSDVMFLSNNRVDFNGKSFAFNNMESPDLNGFLAECNYAYLTRDKDGKIKHSIVNGMSSAYLVKNTIIPAYYGISDCNVFFKNYLNNHKNSMEVTPSWKQLWGDVLQSELDAVKDFKGVLGFRDLYQNKMLGNMAKYIQAFMALMILLLIGYYIWKYVRGYYGLMTSIFMGFFTSIVLFTGLTLIPAYMPELMNLFSNNLANDIGFNSMIFDLETRGNTYKVFPGLTTNVPSIKSENALTLYKYNSNQFNYTKDIYDVTGADLGSPISFNGTEIYAMGDQLKVNYEDMWNSVSVFGDFNVDNVYSVYMKQNFQTCYDYYCPFKFILNGLSNTLNIYSQVAKPEYKTVLYNDQPKTMFLCNSFISSGVFIGYPQKNKAYEDNMKSAFKGYSTTYPLTDFLGLTNNFFKLYNSEKDAKKLSHSEVDSIWYKNMKDVYEENPELFAKKIQQVNSATRMFMLNNKTNMSFISDENFVKTVALYATLTLDQQFSKLGDFIYPIFINFSDLNLGNILQVILPDKNGIFSRYNTDLVDHIVINGGIGAMILFPVALGLMALNVIFMTWYYTIFIILLMILVARKLMTLGNPDVVGKGFLKITISLVLIYYTNIIFYYILYTTSPGLLVKLLSICLFNLLVFFLLFVIAKTVLNNFFDLGNGQLISTFKSSTSKMTTRLERGLDKLKQTKENYRTRRSDKKRDKNRYDKFSNDNLDRYGVSEEKYYNSRRNHSNEHSKGYDEDYY